MDNKIYRTAIDIINLILGFLAVYAIMFTILLLTHSTDSSLLIFILSLSGVLLSYFLKQHIKHIGNFLLLHAMLLAALFFLVSSIAGKILCTVFMACTAIFHLVKRLREEELRQKNTNPSLLMVMGLLYIVNLQLKLPNLAPVLFELTLVFILFYLINSYLINFEHYFSLQQETSNIPLKQIKAVNHTIIVFFLGLCFTSMLTFTKLPLKEILLSLKQGLLSLLRALFSLLPDASANIAETKQKAEEAAPTAQPFQLPDVSKPSPVWLFIQNLITNILIAAVIVAAIALISYAIYKLYQAFYKDKRSLFRDNTEFISPFDKKENVKKDTSMRKGGLMHLWNQSNSSKIRKAFYKAILSVKGKLPTQSSTPVELSQYIVSNHSLSDKEKDTKSQSLAFYYEKARYYKEDCTKEEVEEFKKLLR